MLDTQVCKTCGIEKSLNEFHYRNDNKKYRPDCKPCRMQAMAAKRYGITVGDVEDMLVAQNYCCAICGTHKDDIPHQAFIHNPLVIDHDHSTGEVRGLLCPTCNNGLGHFKDNPRLLINAAQYILKNNNYGCSYS